MALFLRCWQNVPVCEPRNPPLELAVVAFIGLNWGRSADITPLTLSRRDVVYNRGLTAPKLGTAYSDSSSAMSWKVSLGCGASTACASLAFSVPLVSFRYVIRSPRPAHLLSHGRSRLHSSGTGTVFSANQQSVEHRSVTLPSLSTSMWRASKSNSLPSDRLPTTTIFVPDSGWSSISIVWSLIMGAPFLLSPRALRGASCR